MTKNTMIFIFLNMIYLLIWHATNKIRSTKAGKELDNGFEFYNSLNTSDMEAVNIPKYFPLRFLFSFAIYLKQIGRASCRERV